MHAEDLHPAVDPGDAPEPKPHPRTLGWVGTTALAMGGSNQMIFLITALFVGQGDILGQGSAAVPLLIVGLLLGWAAAPAWTELVLMWPNRVGGIAGRLRRGVPAVQPGARRPDRHLLLVGLGADLRADRAPLRLRHPAMVSAGPAGRGRRRRRSCSSSRGQLLRRQMGRAARDPDRHRASATLAFLSTLIPILSGSVDWRQATDFT